MKEQSQLEAHLLDFSNYIYVHTALKPMSKTLFFISRLLLVLKHSIQLNKVIDSGKIPTLKFLSSEYQVVQRRFELTSDDYDLTQVLADIEEQLPVIFEFLVKIHHSAGSFDILGLAFNSLLRGKFEAGEGLGTHLTPEEVVVPTIKMALSLIEKHTLDKLLGVKKEQPLLAGDITGGTGRFMFHLYKQLQNNQKISDSIIGRFYLFDQSKIHTEFCEINFLLDGVTRPRSICIGDSLTSKIVSDLKERFAILLTNPPFGANKYTFTKSIRDHFDSGILKFLKFNSPDSTIDPAWLFIVKNLDLLAKGGVLGIVLPNGIAHSEELVDLLTCYKKINNVTLNVNGVFALPPVTFALGGTVAKTSVLLITKESNFSKLGTATIEHIGFEKSGNKRIDSKEGNQLEQVALVFEKRDSNDLLSWSSSWEEYARLSPDLIRFSNGKKWYPENKISILKDLAEQRREFGKIQKNKECKHLHISILDVEETGLIDIRSCLLQEPVTLPLYCEPGDILISCLNPNIWRATFIPDLGNITWTCSPEFAVLKPYDSSPEGTAKLFLLMQQQSVKQQVVSWGRGTSSSRQRVKKTDLNEVEIPLLNLNNKTIQNFLQSRITFYKNRLAELEFMNEIFNGKLTYLEV